ncbi:MAG: ATP-binding protein [Scytolyngbya sp. HA4215-MV1]|nr:ATP-binding protein [Scytolyngbya sp. HA4215-MV1]
MHTSKLSAQFLQHQAASLLLYQAVLANPIGVAFLELLQAIRHAERNPAIEGVECLQAYGRWFQALATRNQSWQAYLLEQILLAENPFSQQAQQVPFSQLPVPLVKAVRHDLQILQQLYHCQPQQISEWVQTAAHASISPIAWEPSPMPHPPNLALPNFEHWADAAADLAAHYQTFGAGLLAQYRALRWQAGTLIGIPFADPVQVAHLVGYETQKEALLKNTEFLLTGYPALHVLLYGSRGSGKSSLVKGLLNHYADRPLRLVEVAKSDLCELSTIADRLRDHPQKFILFVDDLSFEEDEDAFKALKVVLEGSLTARPSNLVVYATTNRRHLIREFFGDRPRPRDGDEVHAWDTVQEKLSFSDRFGLTLTFEPADQKTYLQIVHHLAVQAGIALSPEDLEFRALQWATRHNGRSGRTARQFIDFLQAELAMGK